MNEEDYCRVKAAPPGSNFYYSSLFQSPDVRQALFALFAFHYEIHETLLLTSDPGVARLKLQWWRDELQRLADSRVNHPVSIQLQAVMQKSGMNIFPLLNHIQAMESLVTAPRGGSIPEWLQNHHTELGELWHYAGETTGCQQRESLAFTGRSGGLVMLFDVVQNLRPLLTRGFNPLPGELMETYGIENRDLVLNQESGATAEMFSAIIDYFITTLNQSFKEFPGMERKKLLYSLIMNRLVVTCCREIRSDGCRLLDRRISLTPIRKLWIAWRTRLIV